MPKKNKVPQEKEKCIVLNKPFVGGYIDRSRTNEAHELINFFMDDEGNHFIYCNPYGQNVRGAKNKEVEYVVFTTPVSNGVFYVEYIAKIKMSLHTRSLPKPSDKNNAKNNKINDTIGNNIDAAKIDINKKLDELGYGSLGDVKYGGIPISDLFTDNAKVIPLTFLVESFYKVNEPIRIKNNDGELFDYNFQRNFGYVTEKSKQASAYKTLKNEIVNAIKNKNCEEINREKFSSSPSTQQIKPTFLDLTSMFRQEECYTQILFKLFSCNQNTLFEFLEFIGKTPKYNTNLYIQPEYEIKDVGRLDIYASYHGENADVTNVILENKIDSGINYITSKGESKDQLTRYYEYFEEEKKKNNAENIYIILCPNEKEALLTAEIQSLKTCDGVKKMYNIITHNKVYEFFNGKEEDFQDKGFEYMHCWGDIIELFRRLSLTRKEICEETLRNNIAKKNTSTTTQIP